MRRPLKPPSERAAGSEGAWQWLDQARRQLDEYFAGTRTGFTVPIDLSSLDPERRAVLEALAQGVEHGETTTYGALAGAVGLTGDGPRRVGVAMARNPVPILVACHRVIGADGKLTGYAGGVGSSGPSSTWRTAPAAGPARAVLQTEADRSGVICSGSGTPFIDSCRLTFDRSQAILDA